LRQIAVQGHRTVVRRVNYQLWLLRLIAWDGLLPALILLAPYVVELLIPNNRLAIELLGVAFPIAGFFIRLVVGKRHIDSNLCSGPVRLAQFGVFFVGIFPLVLIDAFLVLSHVMPKGVLAPEDYAVFGVLFSVYLTAMTLAMYPGRLETP
jgi:hypothetical protein